MDGQHSFRAEQLVTALASRDVNALGEYIASGGGGISHAHDAQARYVFFAAQCGSGAPCHPIASTSLMTADCASPPRPLPLAWRGGSRSPSPLLRCARRRIQAHRQSRGTEEGVGFPPPPAPVLHEPHILRAHAPFDLLRIKKQYIQRYRASPPARYPGTGVECELPGCLKRTSHEACVGPSAALVDWNKMNPSLMEALWKYERKFRSFIITQEELAHRSLLCTAADDVADNVLGKVHQRERALVVHAEAAARQLTEQEEGDNICGSVWVYAERHLRGRSALEQNRLLVAELHVRQRIHQAEATGWDKMMVAARRHATTLGFGIPDLWEVYDLLELGAESDNDDSRQAPDELPRSWHHGEQPSLRWPLRGDRQRLLFCEAIRTERALRPIRELLVTSIAQHERLALRERVLQNRKGNVAAHHGTGGRRLLVVPEPPPSSSTIEHWQLKFACIHEEITCVDASTPDVRDVCNVLQWGISRQRDGDECDRTRRSVRGHVTSDVNQSLRSPQRLRLPSSLSAAVDPYSPSPDGQRDLSTARRAVMGRP